MKITTRKFVFLYLRHHGLCKPKTTALFQQHRKIWFSDNYQAVFARIIAKPNNIYLVNGVPVLWLLAVVLVTVTLAIFGGRIFRWDAGLLYGRAFNKLEELIADLEELRK